MRVNVDIPAGVYANGTARQSRGRWRDSNLVRWPDGNNLQPVGGWLVKTSSPVSGKARAILPWASNGGTRYAAIGTHSKLYAMDAAGALYDITPVGFTTGYADATSATGYGGSTYGTSAYGVARPDSSALIPASTWSLDVWGQYLVGCMDGDGKLYEWQLSTGTKAAVLSAAPTGCTGIVVTAERFIFALKDRTVYWCAQGDNTDWTASSTDQAGDQDLDTAGRLLTGRRVSGGTLLFTSADVWLARYQGLPTVYGFQRVGSDCGIVGKGAAVSMDSRCVWMGRDAFYMYDGSVNALPCDVADYVFSDISSSQISKVSAWHNVQFGEVWWHYPSADSTICDRYVKWNYLRGHWDYGLIDRTCGCAPSVFNYPMAVDSSGNVYDHERGWSWDSTPYVRSGPFEWPGEMGGADRRLMVTGFVPDEGTQGESQVTFYGRENPNMTETTFGPYTISTSPVDVLFSTRELEAKISFTTAADARVGTFEIDIKPVSKR